MTPSGSLPAGSALNPTRPTGVISGTPTWVFATALVVVQATNSGGFLTASLMMTVNLIAVSYSITALTLTKGLLTNQLTTTVTPLTGAMSFTVSAQLPSGLSLSTSTGAITGTPTVVLPVTSTATCTITASHANGGIATSTID